MVATASGAKVLPIVNIAIASMAILFALVCLGGATIWAGPSGEWASLALLPPFFVNIPAGLITLIASLRARRADARLRKIAITMSVLALLSPFVTAVLGGLRT